MSVAERSVRKTRPQGRSNVWLAIVAIVQAAALVFVLLTVARPPTTKTGPLLGQGIKTSDITAFTVTGSKGKSVSLKRSGTQWVLPAEGGYPAKSSRVTSFLQELVGLKRSGLVATTKDAYKRLKVSTTTYNRKVALTLKGGKSETLYIGSEPSYGSTHVRLAGGKGVYVTHSLHASDARTDPSGYVDPTVLTLTQSDVTRVEVKNANGDFVFTRNGSAWSMKGVPSGKTFDPSTVKQMLSNLTDLQLDEPLGKTAKPAYGFAKPLAVVTLTTVSKASGSGSSGSASAASGATASSTSGGASSKSGASSKGGTPSNASNASVAAGKGSTAGKAGTAGKGSTSSTSSAASAKSAAPAKTVTKTTTITVGTKDKAGFYPVRVSSSPFIVRTSGSNLGGVVSKKESDFFTKPKSSASNSGSNGLTRLGGLGSSGGGGAGGGPTGH